jgi:glycosyltransferase involved in cell wall biosynthesis
LPSIETSKGDVDGVPTVVIEAAIAGLPIITTDAGGITDLIVNNDTGIIVPQKDPEALANQIEHLLSHPEIRKSLGMNANKKAGKMFDLDTNIRELENLLLL